MSELFFPLSKLLSFFTLPFNLMACLLALGVVMRKGLPGIAVFFLMVSMIPIGDWLLRPLEYSTIRAALPDQIDGIIVLGGAIDVRTTRDMGQITLNNNSDRLFHALALARKYPQIPLIFTGGSGDLFNPDDREADVAVCFFTELGLPRERIVLERESRNSFEHAVLLKQIVPDFQRQRFLLVTSAFHMPRAVAVFRAQGWTVIPYPVDFITRPDPKLSPEFDMLGSWMKLNRAWREHLGLIMYRLSGKIP